MRIITSGVVTVTLAWSSGALAADPFNTCSDAHNYGYNTVTNLVSASYNKALCDRSLAGQYERFLTAIVPSYLARMAQELSDENRNCLLQGSNEGWFETTSDEYADCQGIAGFEGIQRKLVGEIAGSLLQTFYWLETASYSVDTITSAFAYPYTQLDLTGSASDCETAIRTSLSGVPQPLVTALVTTVCK